MATQISAPDIGYGNPYIDVLVGGNFKWGSGPVTYTFGAAGQTIDGSQTLSWTESEKTMFRAVFQSFEAVCGITFAEVDYSASVNLAEWKMATVLDDPGILGMHAYPEGDAHPVPLNGEFATATNYWLITPGASGYTTVLHELGHALNLAHPHDGGWGTHTTTFPGLNEWPFAPGYGEYGLNQRIWTVMSYYGGWNREPVQVPRDHGDVMTPMAFDVATLQALYGVNTSYKTGNDTYLLPTANVIGTGWSCIWDAGGSDTISNAGSALACTINLLAAPLTGPHAGGYVSWIRGVAGGFTIANGALIENAVGGDGNDLISGNGANNLLQGGAGNDSISGGIGNDTLTGERGNDSLFGGTGNDLLNGGSGDDFILQDDVVGRDTIVGGSGFDGVDYSHASASLNLRLDTGRVEKYQGGLLVGADTLSDIEAIFGTRNKDTITGGAGNELLSGGAEDDCVDGAAGHDTLNGGGGRDSLSGGDGNDYLNGQAGNDTLDAGAGDNTIIGGTGNDILGDVTGNNTYIFDAGFGRDTMRNWRMSGYLNDTEIVQFQGLDARNILFQRDGSDLKISIAGKSDLLRIIEWYDTSADLRGLKHFQIDHFQAGEMILQGQVVSNLVTLIGATPVSMASLIADSSVSV